MIPLIKHYLWAFFFDENAAKRFLFGLGSMAATIITALLVFGLDTIVAWSRKEMLQHLAFVVLTTVATMLPAPVLSKPAPEPEKAP